MSVPRKFLEDWNGRLTVRFLLLTNEVPRIADSPGALASRFVVLTMKNSFFGREDKNLAQRLTAELPSIFAWALDGLDALEADGALIEPAASREAVQLLEELASPILTFVRDECIQEPGASIECSLLFERWADWCRDHHRGDDGAAAQLPVDNFLSAKKIVRDRGSNYPHSFPVREDPQCRNRSFVGPS